MASTTPPAVLVVGAGPTGLLLASELRRRGVDCRLIDARPEPLQWDRATVVHPRSLEVFEALGLLDEFLAAGVPQRSARLHADGRLLGEIDLSTCGSRHGFNLGISEQVTEAILAEHLRAHGGEVERGSRLVALDPQDDGVVAHVERAGAREAIVAGWVVGCDGGHSVTREAICVELEGHDLSEWAVFDVTLDGWPDTYEANYVYLDEVPVILTALPERRWRAYLRPTAPDSDLVADAMTTLARYQPAVAPVDVAAPARFPCHTKVATRFRRGRVLLAGDAAHVCSPAQGHGMNSGLGDAFNVGWKLALVVAGHASPALLDSYEPERRPVAQAITRSGDAAEALQAAGGAAERATRDESLRALFADAEAGHHEAVAEAELDIDYGSSPIVLGDPTGGLSPGQRLPDGLRPPRPTGHSVLLVGDRADALAEVERAVRAAADPALVDATIVLERDAAVAVGGTGVTLVVARPDGHLGLVAAHEHAAALRRYQDVVRGFADRPRRGAGRPSLGAAGS